jgi:hypothetical protein
MLKSETDLVTGPVEGRISGITGSPLPENLSGRVRAASEVAYDL